MGGYGEGRETRPIFKPLRTRYRVFGVAISKFLIILAAGLVGLGLAFATGSIQHQVQVAYTPAEKQTIAGDYESIANAMTTIEKQRAGQGASTYSEMELTSQQRETIAKANQYGIKAGMTSDQLEELVPKQHTVSQPVVPDVVRYILLIGVPVVVLFTLFVEINRTNMLKEITRALKWANSQKVYRNRPIEYVERECGTSYWEALGAAQQPKH